MKDYINVCEIEWAAQQVPPFLVASQFLYPTVCLLSKRKYLFPVLGGIHVANTFILHKPLADDKEYTVRSRIDDAHTHTVLLLLLFLLNPTLVTSAHRPP